MVRPPTFPFRARSWRLPAAAAKRRRTTSRRRPLFAEKRPPAFVGPELHHEVLSCPTNSARLSVALRPATATQSSSGSTVSTPTLPSGIRRSNSSRHRTDVWRSTCSGTVLPPSPTTRATTAGNRCLPTSTRARRCPGESPGAPIVWVGHSLGGYLGLAHADSPKERPTHWFWCRPDPAFAIRCHELLERTGAGQRPGVLGERGRRHVRSTTTRS